MPMKQMIFLHFKIIQFLKKGEGGRGGPCGPCGQGGQGGSYCFNHQRIEES